MKAKAFSELSDYEVSHAILSLAQSIRLGFEPQKGTLFRFYIPSLQRDEAVILVDPLIIAARKKAKTK